MRRLAVALVVALIASLFGAPRPAAAAGCGMPGTPTTTVYLPNVTKTLGGPSGWVTPFIVQNVGVGATTLEVSFYGFYDGALVTCRAVPALAPGTSFADVPNNDADLPDNAQFAVVVRSFGSPVVAVVNEQQGVGARSESMSYVGLTQGATTLALPYVAKAVGGWTTTFVMQNVGAADAAVTIAFASADGTRTATLTRTIAAGRSAFVDPSYEPSLLAGTEYAVTVTSSQPVAAVVNAQNDLPTVASPRALSYNGVPAGVAASAYLPSVAKNTDGIGRTTRVIVENTGATDATPSLAFQGASGGAVTLAAPAAVKPGRSWSFDPRYQTDGVTACGSAASALCLADGEYGLTVSGGSFAVVGATLSTTTAMGNIAAVPAPSRIYLPNITRTLGGATGWTTPIVLQSAGATSATLRWYRFADGSLALTQYVPSLVPGGSVRIDPRTVSGLADGTQYAVVVDATAPIVAVVQEMSFQGGDGTMAYEGFAASGALTPAPVLSSIAVTPATAAVGLNASQQLTATVTDQSGNAVIGVPVTWSVSPATAGTVSASGLFTAGGAATTATVSATFGTLSGSAVLTLQATTLTTGGFTFMIRATSTSDLYIEQSISTADSQTIATTVDADAADVQTTYGRPFTTRPQVYVFPTTPAYTSGLQSVFGVSATQAAITGQQTSGFFQWTSTNGAVATKLALNWQRVGAQTPMTTSRHELTHMMITQIAKPSASISIPAWINEGSARLEEFTVAGTTHWQNENRYGAASMVAARNYFALVDLTDQTTWNARTGDPAVYQYYEASQMVQLLRSDVGTAGVTRIFDLMGQGQAFDAAFQTVTGQTTATFAASVPARLQAISAVYPYVVTSNDTDAGAGLSYFLYGFQPNSSLTVNIQSGQYSNTNPARTANAYGFVLTSYLGANWPTGTYSFTVTGITPPSSTTPGVSVTFTVTAAKTSSVDPGAAITP
ncbi:MAG: hypothetical protein KGN00_08325 [Chloroflexota bacterium]|nr:hypothetical protein [Chloroflexota bacterium]